MYSFVQAILQRTNRYRGLPIPTKPPQNDFCTKPYVALICSCMVVLSSSVSYLASRNKFMAQITRKLRYASTCYTETKRAIILSSMLDILEDILSKWGRRKRVSGTHNSEPRNAHISLMSSVQDLVNRFVHVGTLSLMFRLPMTKGLWQMGDMIDCGSAD